jgi:uncharacterized membrane protein YoaK (UPF0700 family)
MITSLISSQAEKYSSHVAPAYNPKNALTAEIWISFILGALSGAAAALHFKQWGMFGIGMILLVLIFRYLPANYGEP